VDRGTVAHSEAGLVESIRTEVRQESPRWGVSAGIAEALLLLPVLGTVAIVLVRADKPLFRFITDEDSVLEWPQFFGFAAASLFALVCAWRLRRAGRPLVALAYLVFAIGCFVIAGEEIAWGQRILGYGTPESLREINEQEEVTLHNINSVQHLTNIAYLVAGLYGSLCAWFVRWRASNRSTDLVDLLMPPLFLTGLFFVMFGYKFVRFAFFPESGFSVTRAGEWAEFCLALGFALFAILQSLRLRRLAASGRAP
jgi:hypothetical protein